MKTIKQNFLDWNYRVLLSSLKRIDLSIILIVILDAIFYLSSAFIYLNWFKIIQAKEASFNLPSNIQSLPLSQLQQLTKDAQSFYYFFILSFLLVVISIIFMASILKGIIWAKTTKAKITLKLISKFFLLNLAWMGFWFALIIAIAKFVEQFSVRLFAIIAILLGVYFTNTLYPFFMKKQTADTIKYVVKLNVKKPKISSAHDLMVTTRLAAVDFLNTLQQVQMFTSIRDSIKLSITKIHMFALPYALIFLILYIISKISSIVVFPYSSFIFIFILLLYIAVVRYYVSELAFELKKTLKPKPL